ncbi:Ig-like domain-containing protein [Treponema primitia]|uniref:SwmB domain-containing protein n=1 Tax=Treponema primitia TaxID=88058 RepID=UPI003980BB4E
MKNNKFIVMGMLAVLLIFAFVLTACGGADGGPTGGHADTTAPTVTGAVIENSAKNVLTVTFSEVVTITDANGFSITGSTGATAITAVSGTDTNALSFTLNGNAVHGETITFSYVATSGNVKDAAGNALAAFADKAVTNNVNGIVGGQNDITAPQLSTALIASDAPGTLALTFSEPVTGVSAADFTVTGSPDTISISSASGSGTNWTLTLSRPAVYNETITLAYNGTAIVDTADTPNALAAFTGKAVTNQIVTFLGLYTSGNKTISFSDTNWAVKIDGNWSDGSIYVVGIINGTTPQYTVSGNTATWTAAGTGSGKEGTATLSGNTLTVLSGNAAINGTYTKQAVGLFRIKVTGIPPDVISLLSASNPLSKILFSIGDPGSLSPSNLGSTIIAARDSDAAGWGDIIGDDWYECWMYDTVAQRLYYFGTPGTYDIRFLAQSLSVYKYKSTVQLQINETNIIPYSSFSDFTVSTKKLVITGITDTQKTAGQSGFMVGVFPAGTTLGNVVARTNLIAGADDEEDISISGVSPSYTATINNLLGTWTDINTCDIYVTLGSTYYMKTGVTASSATINVDMSTFVPITSQ